MRRALVLFALALMMPACHTEHRLGALRSDAGGTTSACGRFVVGVDLAVCTACLSGPGAETPAAVDVAPTGGIVIRATIGGNDFRFTPREIIRGRAGVILRLSPDGRTVVSVWRVGDSITDLEIDTGRGTIVVLGAPFGLTAITPDGRKLWEAPVVGTRVSAGSDGTVAVLDDLRGELHVFEWTGAPRGTFALPGAGLVASDVAVHGGSKTVVVTGSVAAGATRQPFLDGHGYDGVRKWRSYGWRATDLTARMLHASTRGVRVAIGRDDRLYYAGESHGGNTTHSRDPRDLELPANTRSYDNYTRAFDVGPAFVLFVARLRAADGAFEVGQMHLARMADGQPASGQSVNPLAIAADEQGNVLVGGMQGCCLPDQGRRTVRGTQTTTSFPDSDAFALMIPADFGRRLLWTTFGRGGASRGVGVALARGTAALLALQDQAAALKAPLITTPEALQPRPGGGASDSYLAIWSAP